MEIVGCLLRGKMFGSLRESRKLNIGVFGLFICFCSGKYVPILCEDRTNNLPQAERRGKSFYLRG